MTPWIKRSLIGLFGLSVALGGLTACGHRHDGGGWQLGAQEQGPFRQRVLDRVAARMELNTEQKQRLAAVADKLREQRLALAGQGGVQVQALVAGDKFDRARAQTLIAEKTAAVNARSPELVSAFGDFYDSLNPAQQAKLREFMQRRHGGRWWHRG